VLILVRRRAAVERSSARSRTKAFGCGADRLVLTEHIAVMT